MTADWLLWQLADSAFPTGGFAHSGGLEAAVQLGEVTTAVELRAFLEGAAWQAGYAALPFVRAAHEEPGRLAFLDAHAHAFLTNHVARAASRTQGRALVTTCARAFPGAGIAALYDAVRARSIEGHHAPLFGAATRSLGVAGDDATRLFLFLATRQLGSAAVRLGIVGPQEAARTQHELTPTLEAVHVECKGLPLEAAAQTAPRFDLFASMHDQLYARLFQS